MLANISNLPIALVHGWGGSFDATYGAFGWREAAAKAGRLLIEIDLPGHGAISASTDPLDYADLASGLAARLPGGKIDAVGFSLGGKLLLELAMRQPSRFRRIVIAGVGNNIFMPEPAGDALAAALEKGITQDTPAAIAALVRYSELSKSNPLAIAAVLRRPANPVITPERLKQIKAEVLLVNGDQDNIARPDSKFKAAMPQVRVRQLVDIDHLGLPKFLEFQCLCYEFLNEG